MTDTLKNEPQVDLTSEKFGYTFTDEAFYNV